MKPRFKIGDKIKEVNAGYFSPLVANKVYTISGYHNEYKTSFYLHGVDKKFHFGGAYFILVSKKSKLPSWF